MSQALKDGVFFAIPFISTLILSIILGYLYYQDRNKRKLLFALGIFLTSFGFYNSVITSFGWKPIFPLSCWLFMPLALAFLIAALSSFLQVKNFDKSFAIFAAGTAVSLVAFFTQLPFKAVHVAVLISFIGISVPILIRLYIKSKNQYDLSFLIATLCFLFQSLVSDLGTSQEIPVMLTLFGVVFIALMFNGSNTSTSSNLAEFVVLENKLNEANRNLKDIQEKLLKSERLATIGELAGLIGHDLRNPLQGIAGATYYIKTHNTKDAETQEMIENIETCIQRSDKIITDLIEYSQTIIS
jgi:signal transduction histidine kinase